MVVVTDLVVKIIMRISATVVVGITISSPITGIGLILLGRCTIDGERVL